MTEPVHLSERPSDQLWETLVLILGYRPRTRQDERVWGRAVREFLYAGATAEELIGAAEEYRKEWPDVTLTIHALLKWFGHFAARSAARTNRPAPCPECEMGGGYHVLGCSQVKA